MTRVQERLKELAERTGDNRKAVELLASKLNIEAKFYENSVVLNYALISPMMEDFPLVSECRALHLSLDDLSIVSRAFDRFPNWGEPGSEDFVFDAETAVLDKIDGSLVILYFSPETSKWEFRTRGTAFAECRVGGTRKTFRDLIDLAAGNADFEGLDRGVSWVFELTAPENRVVVPYEGRALHYITAYRNADGREIPYEEGFGEISKRLSCLRIPSHPFGSVSEVVESAHEIEGVDEGYVVRNGRGQRVKIKNPAYVALHHMRNNGVLTDSRILDLVESGEDSEYLAYFPEDAGRFEEIVRRRDGLFDAVRGTFANLGDAADQKEFALRALKFPYSAMLFKMRQGVGPEEFWASASASFKEKMLGIGNMDVEESPAP